MSSNICSQFFVKTICKKKIDKSKIFITFDDGISKEFTPKILDILDKHNAKATFFVIGKKLAENKHIAKNIIKKGHLIGNHTYSHSYFFGFYRTNKVISEILETNKLIEKVTGIKTKFFRPPFGVTNPNIGKAVKKTNMICIGWSIRSLDTVNNEDKVLKRIKKVKPGDIILFHDNRGNTIEILDKFLRYCKKNNLNSIIL